jgi:parallel beta-helix repeat protein
MDCAVWNNTINAHGEATGAISIFGGSNCNVTSNQISSTLDDWWHAIDCSGSDHRFVLNRISNATIGIYLRAIFCYVANNIIDSCQQAGIELIKSNSTIVVSNDVRGSSKLSSAGISLVGGIDQVVQMNNLTHSQHGIALQGSSNTTVHDNTCNDTRYGIAFLTYGRYEVPNGPSTNCSIHDNIMNGGGGLVFSATGSENWNYANLEIVGNEINNQSILYCDGLSSMAINGSLYGQVILMRCENLTLQGGLFQHISSDIEVSGYRDSGYASPVHVLFSENCTMNEVISLACTVGINIFRSTGILLNSCYATACSWTGILAIQSSTLDIENCNSHYSNTGTTACSWTGILAIQSSTLDIENCNSHYSNTGITMQEVWNSLINASYTSFDNRGVHLTECENCTIKDVFLYNCSTGLVMKESNTCYIQSCDIILCSMGINMFQASRCQLQDNIVMYSIVGIYLYPGSDLNWIYSNYFAENEVHAICLGSSNHWDDGVGTGNYWDDAQGSGPYTIDEDDIDYYPLPSTHTTTETTSSTTTIGTIGTDFLYISAVSGLVVGIIAALILFSEKQDKPKLE